MHLPSFAGHSCVCEQKLHKPCTGGVFSTLQQSHFGWWCILHLLPHWGLRHRPISPQSSHDRVPSGTPSAPQQAHGCVFPSSSANATSLRDAAHKKTSIAKRWFLNMARPLSSLRLIPVQCLEHVVAQVAVGKYRRINHRRERATRGGACRARPDWRLHFLVLSRPSPRIPTRTARGSTADQAMR